MIVNNPNPQPSFISLPEKYNVWVLKAVSFEASLII
jgi:hypothetical protein